MPRHVKTEYFVTAITEGSKPNRVRVSQPPTAADAIIEASHYSGDYQAEVLCLDHYSNGTTTERAFNFRKESLAIGS